MENLEPFEMTQIMENLGSFDDAMGDLETLIKAMGKLGAKWPEGKWEIGPLMVQWNVWALLMMQWANKLETLSKRKLGPLITWAWEHDFDWGPALDHEFFSNGITRLHCTLSNLWAPNFNWEIVDVMQAEKEYTSGGGYSHIWPNGDVPL